MKTHSHFASRILGILTIAAAFGGLQPTDASAQTAEGTPITNTAFVDYTDANGNSYVTESNFVTVTVGFSAGVNVAAAQGTATPASPSSLNTMDFDVVNMGNGTDNVSVVDDITDATVITAITNYRFNSTDYGDRAALNVALAAFPMAQGVTITITVEYTVAPDKAGQPSTYTLTATSVRDGGVSDPDNTVVTPGFTGIVATTPDGGQLLTELPSGGGNPTYTFTFNVENFQNGVDDFDLVVTSPGPVVIGIISVNGVGGTTTTITLAASANQDIDVVYTVADVAAGSVDTLFLVATAVNGSTNDQGFADLTVVKASLTITKEAWENDESGPLSANVLPGDFFKYKVIVTNGGTADASSVHVDDNLPAEVSYVLATGDVAGWSFVESSGDVDADLAGTLAAGATRFFWIEVQVN